MKTIYNVYHHYDVDGGFGDAISQKDLLFTTDSKEVADAFVSKYDNDHVYDIPYAKLYRGALRIEEVAIVSSYEDIPQSLIQWGEENSKWEDYNENDWSLLDEDNSAESKLDTLVSLAELKQDLEYPVVPSIDILMTLLKTAKWKYAPWHEESAYYTPEDIVYDIQEVADRLRERGSYFNIGEQRERLAHKGVLDGGMVGEHAVECKFEFGGMLFCVATEADRVSIGFYPADSGNLAPFADEVWCIFYSEEDRPRHQRIKRVSNKEEE